MGIINRYHRLIFILPLTFAFTAVGLQAQGLNPRNLPNTTLTAAVTATDTELVVASTAGFPGSGSLLIGTEILSYQSKTGTAFLGVTRAQDSTTAAAHNADDVVKLMPPNAAILTAAIDTAATTLTVNSTAGFPTTFGTLRIDDEEMSYGGLSTTTFTGLIRQVNGTTAAAHEAGSLVYARPPANQSQILVFPKALSGADNISGLILLNDSPGSARVGLFPIKADGTQLTGTNITTPVNVTLEPHAQYAALVNTVFGDLATNTDFYIQTIVASDFLLGATSIIGTTEDGALSRIELAPYTTQPQNNFILPVALQKSNSVGEDTETEITLVNISFATTVRADFVGANGALVEGTDISLNSQQRTTKTLGDLFPGLKDQNIQGGYIRLTHKGDPGARLSVLETVRVGKETAVFAGLNAANFSRVIYLPLFVTQGAYSTRLILIEPTPPPTIASTSTVQFRITAIRRDGTVLGAPVVDSLPLSGQYSKFVSEIFNLTGTDLELGYLKIEVLSNDSPGLLANAIVLQNPKNELASVQGQVIPQSRLVFAPAVLSPSIVNAYAIVNPNDVSVDLTFEIFDRDGNSLGRVVRNGIAPRAMFTPIIKNDFFPTVPDDSTLYVIATATKPVFAVQVFDFFDAMAIFPPLRRLETPRVTPSPLNLVTPSASSTNNSNSRGSFNIEISQPAPIGGIPFTVESSHPLFVTVLTPNVRIEEGLTRAEVQVRGELTGASSIFIRGPEFLPATQVVRVTPVVDPDLARNITLSPLTATVRSGEPINFTLQFDTTKLPPVFWTVNGLENGNTANGLLKNVGNSGATFIAPILLPNDPVLKVVVAVINNTDPFFSARAEIFVLPPTP